MAPKPSGSKAGGKGGKPGAAPPSEAKHAVIYAASASEIKDDFPALIACLVSMEGGTPHAQNHSSMPSHPAASRGVRSLFCTRSTAFDPLPRPCSVHDNSRTARAQRTGRGPLARLQAGLLLMHHALQPSMYSHPAPPPGLPPARWARAAGAP